MFITYITLLLVFIKLLIFGTTILKYFVYVCGLILFCYEIGAHSCLLFLLLSLVVLIKFHIKDVLYILTPVWVVKGRRNRLLIKKIVGFVCDRKPITKIVRHLDFDYIGEVYKIYIHTHVFVYSTNETYLHVTITMENLLNFENKKI